MNKAEKILWVVVIGAVVLIINIELFNSSIIKYMKHLLLLFVTALLFSSCINSKLVAGNKRHFEERQVRKEAIEAKSNFRKSY